MVVDSIQQSIHTTNTMRLRHLPSYIVDILAGNQKFPVLLVIVGLALSLSVRPTIAFYVDILPILRHLSKNLTQIARDSIPENAEVVIKNGQVTTNMPEPFYITVKRDDIDRLFGENVSSDTPSISKVRLITVDTKGSAENFEEYQTLALLTKNSFVYYNDDKINIQPLREMYDITISRNYLENYVHKFLENRFFRAVTYFLILFAPIILILTTLVSELLAFLWIGLLMWGICRIVGLARPWKDIFKFTVALAVVPLLLWQLIGFTYHMSYNVYLMIILTLGFFGIKKLKSQSLSPTA